MNTVVKVGDIIDGRKVTKVFSLCGGLAYQSEPVTGKVIEKNGVPFLEEFEKEEPAPAPEPEKPKRGRKKKEV